MGVVNHTQLEVPLGFSDLGEKTLRLDTMMNAGAFPQSFMRLRSFQKSERCPSGNSKRGEADSERAGELATFLIQVKTRKGADWQGTVAQVGGRETEFSGVLELLRTIYYACEWEIPQEDLIG